MSSISPTSIWAWRGCTRRRSRAPSSTCVACAATGSSGAPVARATHRCGQDLFAQQHSSHCAGVHSQVRAARAAPRGELARRRRPRPRPLPRDRRRPRRSLLAWRPAFRRRPARGQGSGGSSGGEAALASRRGGGGGAGGGESGGRAQAGGVGGADAAACGGGAGPRRRRRGLSHARASLVGAPAQKGSRTTTTRAPGSRRRPRRRLRGCKRCRRTSCPPRGRSSTGGTAGSGT